MQLINGKEIAQTVKTEIAQEVKKLTLSGKRAPHLVAVLVGNDGASETYVASKVKSCEQVGFRSTLKCFEDSITEDELLKEIAELNVDAEVDGFIVQLPLPKHIDEDKVVMAIDPQKDVDGFHPTNVGRLSIGLPTFVSATPSGILELLQRYNIETSGKNCLVIGRSNIVGRPMSTLLSRKGVDGTVTIAHSRTKNIKSLALQADIIVVALGIPNFLTADMVSPGAVVIDVGITRVDTDENTRGYKLMGDVAFDEVAPKCSYITPVPGGVGPMTIVSLLKNTLLAAKNEVYN